MQKLFITLSQKQVGILYHYTNKDSFLRILRSGKLELSTGRARGAELAHQGNKNFFASFTRSRFGGYHFRDGVKSNNSDTDIMLTLDGNKLAETNKIIPIDYWGQRGDLGNYSNKNKEVEERLISNKKDIDIIKYINRVDFIQSGNGLDKMDYGENAGKWLKSDVNRFEESLGSIILQLKKNKIPYAFYHSMNDWARRQGEYSYIGKKGVSIVKSVEKSSVLVKPGSEYTSIKSLLECFSQKPYEKLSTVSKGYCKSAYKNPSSFSSIFNIYEVNRKPGSDQVLRDMALRIANALKRLNINSLDAARNVLASKYEVFDKEELARKLKERNSDLAKLLVEALTKKLTEWDTSSFIYYQFKNTKDIFSMVGIPGDIRNLLESTDSDTLEFRRLVEKLNLGSPFSVVLYIYEENVKDFR